MAKKTIRRVLSDVSGSEIKKMAEELKSGPLGVSGAGQGVKNFIPTAPQALPQYQHRPLIFPDQWHVRVERPEPWQGRLWVHEMLGFLAAGFSFGYTLSFAISHLR